MKIICPYHNDTNASMHLYPEGGYCFVCLRWMPIEGTEHEKRAAKPKDPENLAETFEYINSCELKDIRGLKFRGNNKGYFIEWPNQAYYKFRLNEGKLRYLAPAGHTPPLLKLGNKSATHLMLVEGEINARSVEAALGDQIAIVSPGASSTFTTKKDDLLKLAAGYLGVSIWVDHDPAGMKAIWAVYPELLKQNPNALYLTLDQDFNDILTSAGKSGIISLVKPYIGDI